MTGGRLVIKAPPTGQSGETRMTGRIVAGSLALALAALLAPEAHAQKTLVYCSEASPEGFNPQLFTAGTTFDASSRAIYNTLVEFEHGTTNLRPGLAESWEVSDDGLQHTSICAPACNSRPPKASRCRAISMPTT